MKYSRLSTRAAAVLLGALSFSACGQNNSDTDSGNGPDSGSTTEMPTDATSAASDTTDTMMAADSTGTLDE